MISSLLIRHRIHGGLRVLRPQKSYTIAKTSKLNPSEFIVHRQGNFSAKDA